MQGSHGSASLFSDREQFASAILRLDPRDRIAVSEWCDNGDSRFVLPPSLRNVDVSPALQELTKALPFFVFPPASHVGEFALEHLVRLMIAEAHTRTPEPLPVIVFLNEDYTGMPDDELRSMRDDLLGTSGVVFGIRSDAVGEMPALSNGEHGQILRYLSETTGGTYFSVPPLEIGAALQNVILRLHFRYELGIKPPALDGSFRAADFEQLRIQILKKEGDPDKEWKLAKGSARLTVGPYAREGAEVPRLDPEKSLFTNKYLEWDKRSVRIYLEAFNKEENGQMLGWFAAMPKSQFDPLPRATYSGPIR